MNTVKRIIAAILVSAVLLVAFSGCAVIKGDAVMEYGDYTVTEAMWSYWMRSYKTLYLYSFNNSKDTLSFWNTEIDEGYTYEDHIIGMIKDHAKQVLVAAYLFDLYKLSFTGEQKNSVEERIDTLITTFGGKNTLNETLGEMGLNIETLKSIYYAEEKLNTVKEYLFGDNGSYAVDDNDREKYYEENYWCANWIYVYTSQEPKRTEDGKYIVDSNGKTVYEQLTDEGKAEKAEKLEKVRRELQSGKDFSAVRDEYSEEDLEHWTTYTDGVFLCANDIYREDLSEYIEYMAENVLSELEVGGYTEFEHGGATVIVKKCALKSYASLTSAELKFMVDFEEYVLDDKLETFISGFDVVTNDDVLARYDIKTVSGSKYASLI